MKTLRRQAGLTLVELMISTMLSLVLLSGVLFVFSANKATYRMQSGLGALQENGRYAIRQITADLQLAGFGGCQSPHLRPRVINIVTPAPPATNFLDNYASGEFFEGRNDQSAILTLGGREIMLGTDSIEIRGPLKSTVGQVTGPILTTAPVTVQGTSSGFATNEYLLISDCSSATVFRASNVTTGSDVTTIAHTAGNISNELIEPYGSDSLVMELATHTYFVGDTGRDNPSGQDILALYRFDGNNAVELVDGVEDLQIQYALDSDNDGVIDWYQDASGVSNWSDVMAVRVSLLMNSIDDASTVEAPYTFFPSSSTAISPSSGDLRLRQEFSSLISVRNSVL